MVILYAAMPSGSTRHFTHEGHRLVYEEHGSGNRPLVLMPGLLLPRSMHRPLAEALAERGNRVILLDLLGHGESDRPPEMWQYSMPQFGEQVLGLLDALDLDEAVVGGTSLGANVALEAAVRAPKRLRGAVIEMPVLDNAILGCILAFSPLIVGLTLGEPVARAVSRVARLVPRGGWWLADVGLDWVSQDPKPSAALLQGTLYARGAPHRSERRKIETPSLVIGHPRDPLHPFSDADELARELPRGRLLDANSILELRVAPARLTNEIARFLDECWRPASTTRRTRSASA